MKLLKFSTKPFISLSHKHVGMFTSDETRIWGINFTFFFYSFYWSGFNIKSNQRFSNIKPDIPNIDNLLESSLFPVPVDRWGWMSAGIWDFGKEDKDLLRINQKIDFKIQTLI